MQRTVLLTAFLACLLPVSADTVLLKTGQRVEGKIINETPQFVTVEVPFSETIMEKRIIARADIATVEKVAGEDIAYQGIQETPDPDTLLGPEAVNEFLDGRLRPFVKEYPNYVHVPELKKRIARLEADAKRLDSGDIKIFGMWLSPSQQTAEKYQVEAARIFVELRKLNERDAFGDVLNEFGILSTKFPGSIGYVRAVPIAKEAARSFIQQIDFTLANLPATLAERQQSLDLAGVGNRAQVQSALDRQDAYAVSLAERARTQRVDFYAILAYDEKGLTAMRKSAAKLLQTIDSINTASLERAIKVIVQTHSFIESGNLAAAETTSRDLAEEWPKYEGVARIKQRIDTAKRDVEMKKAADQKAAAEAAKAAEPAPAAP